MIYCLEGNGCRPSHYGDGWSMGGVCYTLNTIERHCVVYAIENHPNDSRVKLDNRGIVQTLNQWMGTGGGNVPMVMVELNVSDTKTIQECIPPGYGSISDIRECDG